jgi:DNA-nicking Smr family endonuclease
VRGVVSSHPAVAAFADAPPERGGWGATVVRLREAGEPQAGPGDAVPR